MSEGRSWQFSPLGAAVAVVTVGVGAAAGLALVPTVGSYLGMVLGGFLAGLATEDRPVLESGLAAALAGLGIISSGALAGNGILDALTALGSVAPTALLVSTALSFGVGAFGAHFGDDLRAGLTTPVETPPAGSTTTGPAGAAPTDGTTSLRESDEAATSTDVTSASTDEEPTGTDRTSASAEEESTGTDRTSASVELERE